MTTRTLLSLVLAVAAAAMFGYYGLAASPGRSRASFALLGVLLAMGAVMVFVMRRRA